MNWVLVIAALRSLAAHKGKTLIVGSIIFFGAFLVVVGTALLDSIDRAMARSITASLTGHLQVYSQDARDELAMFGSGFMGGDDFGAIRDFDKLRGTLEALPEVRAVVPMGLQLVTVMTGNEIDLTLSELRRATGDRDLATRDRLVAKLRNIAADLYADADRRLLIAKDKDAVRESLKALDRVTQDEFADFMAQDSEAALTFLDAKVAPLAGEGAPLYFRVVGTDLERFAELFDRFYIIKGGPVPKGEPGILFSERLYEKRVKNRVARELDRIHEGLSKRGRTIAGDPEILDVARRLPRQYRRISYELSAADTGVVEAELRKLLPTTQGDIKTLLQEFLRVDDQNFAERHRFFYEVIAPRIKLYPIPLGSEITLRSITKAGYYKALNLKVYGIYGFRGLESSDLAGAQNLVDIGSFRELYGVMTEEKKRELEAIRRAVGVLSVAREDAEAALFGGDAPAPRKAAPMSDDSAVLPTDQGLAISAAVLLKDGVPVLWGRDKVAAALTEAGLPLKVVDWQAASGIVGQLVLVLRLVLYVAIVIIFVVALIIINNAMLVAMMDRVPEIGTMRAMGARRLVIGWMFLLEMLVLAVIAGLLGVAGGAGLIEFLARVGIPATSDVMLFFFSGPRLYPSFGLSHLVAGLVSVVVVSLLSTLQPARMAMRVQPIVAMQAAE